MQFINPVTGGPVGAVLDYAAQHLRPGEETRPKRETCSTFMVVMDGQATPKSADAASNGRPTTSW